MAPKLSLYASLLGPSEKAPEEPSEPNEEEVASKKPLNAAALRFQPQRRPQIASQKPKQPKFAFAKASSSIGVTSSSPAKTLSNNGGNDPPSKMTLADWTAENDDENEYYVEDRERRREENRARRKKKKKNKGEQDYMVQNWDDLYDPTRPNNYEEYMRSDERIREIREWKDRLYAHKMKRRSSDASSDYDDRRNDFAPPSSYNFAPPPSFAPPGDINMDESGEDAFARRIRMSQLQSTDIAPPPPPPPADINMEESGEEAFSRRMRLSQQIPPPPPPPEEPIPESIPPPPKPSATISRAPVRYSLPAAPAEIPTSEAELEKALQESEADDLPADEMESDDTPRTNRPGQKGFAQRLMAKYGWTKGSGLGAEGTGITSALKVKVDKSKGGHGKILGGKQKDVQEGKFGPMSEVVILKGMLDGLNVSQELEDGTLVQEIGEECGEKYGTVERVFIPRDSSEEQVPVFVQFTSPLSALRAVNALEGRLFNGNIVKARFFDVEKFKKGVI